MKSNGGAENELLDPTYNSLMNYVVKLVQHVAELFKGSSS